MAEGEGRGRGQRERAEGEGREKRADDRPSSFPAAWSARPCFAIPDLRVQGEKRTMRPSRFSPAGERLGIAASAGGRRQAHHRHRRHCCHHRHHQQNQPQPQPQPQHQQYNPPGSIVGGRAAHGSSVCRKSSRPQLAQRIACAPACHAGRVSAAPQPRPPPVASSHRRTPPAGSGSGAISAPLTYCPARGKRARRLRGARRRPHHPMPPPRGLV